ncbi:hypothetical protein ACQP2F_30550 [Actinoplanes sp. CA-030573]|uniref:hypothetical protein n=1 Tax=Actinoplanes sp. CA-030573 TaxID=3239898 RepID=UPI003D917E0F
MPRRRLTAVPLFAATVALAAGCSIEVSPDAVSAPIPFSVAPTPSSSAGVPKYVCTAGYKILTDGAVKLAGYIRGSGPHNTQGLRDTFTEMAAKFTAEADKTTTDPALQSALREVAASLTAGAQQPDPKAYANGDFQTVGQKLDAACAGA